MTTDWDNSQYDDLTDIITPQEEVKVKPSNVISEIVLKKATHQISEFFHQFDWDKRWNLIIPL